MLRINKIKYLAAGVQLRLLLIVLVFFIQGCSENENFLLGTWEFDGDRTFSELKLTHNAPAKLLKCYEIEACGHGSVFIYTSSSWSHYFKSNSDEVHGPVSYDKIVVNDTEYRISTVAQDAPQTYTVKLVNDNLVYIEFEIDGFLYNEYLKKIH